MHSASAIDHHRWSIALGALAVLTRVAAALVLGDRFHFADETIYVDAARRLLAGEGYGDGYANVPGPPLLLALLAAPWPTSIVALRVAHAAFTGAVGALVLQGLGTRTVGPRATRVGLAVYALDPVAVVAGALLYPEASAAVVLASALLAGVVAASGAARAARAGSSRRAAAAAGALLGLTILMRPVATVLVPLVMLWIGAMVPGSLVRRATHAGLVAIACAVVVAPWGLQNLRTSGRLVPASLHGLQHAPVAPDDIARDGLVAALGRKAWREPRALAARVGGELGHFWELYPTRLTTDSAERRDGMHRIDPRLPREASFAPSLRNAASAVTFGSELALALVGIVLGWRRRRAAIVLLAGVALVYGLGYALFIAKLRYRIVVLPGLFLLAGLGVAALRPRAVDAPPERRA